MTIVVSVKVHDGIVLASDSASTLTETLQDGSTSFLNVWNHQNKLFNLLKGSSIGGLTFGHGSIGHASISTLAKDLRGRFGSSDPAWRVNPEDFSVYDVAIKVREFFYNEKYLTTYGSDATPPGALGFWVAGYSTGSELSELWDVSIADGVCVGPVRLRDGEDAGLNWGGDLEAVTRLVKGHSEHLTQSLLDLGVPSEQAQDVIAAIEQDAHVELGREPISRIHKAVLI